MGCCGSAAAKIAADDPQQPASAKKGKPALADLRALHKSSLDDLKGVVPGFGADANKNASLRSGASCLQIMEKNAVLVAVRLRPMNQREKSAGSKECLKCLNPTSLALESAQEKARNFTFDCVMPAQDASQMDVFDRTARPLLHKVLEGYNGCLFAYGQTGSGKTYTMQGEGSGENMGIIPLLCTEMFHLVEERSGSKNVTVLCSLMEIYNEQLHDLLKNSDEPPKDLQIRDETALGGRGLYVEGITEHVVVSSVTVQKLIASGQARRAVGKTNMNEHSSRSHSVLTFRISTSDVDDEEGTSKTTSKLHLVDLAGSERQKSTGATGDRLKEGAQINLSLSALGNVINALTEGSGKGRHVPYRDSKLTRLLQDSLGGNSFTVMICNVSPAEINTEETLSSLRFAERAKKIENKATVNRDPKTARIAELLEENKVLKAQVQALQAHAARLEEFY